MDCQIRRGVDVGDSALSFEMEMGLSYEKMEGGFVTEDSAMEILEAPLDVVAEKVDVACTPAIFLEKTSVSQSVSMVDAFAAAKTIPMILPSLEKLEISNVLRAEQAEHQADDVSCESPMMVEVNVPEIWASEYVKEISDGSSGPETLALEAGRKTMEDAGAPRKRCLKLGTGLDSVDQWANLSIGRFDVDILSSTVKTPSVLPLLTGIADTCPGAPRRHAFKSRKLDLCVCQKLEFFSE